MKEPIRIEEWVVERTRRELARVWVLLGEGAAAPWLAKLRGLLPELGARTPVDLLADLIARGARVDEVEG